MNDHTTGTARLLPWTGSGGKPCYLIGDGKGYISKVADRIESVQLGMAAELLGHVAELLSDRRATSDQLRYAVARMAESLRDVHRIAESRGARLSAEGPAEEAAPA
ncbi:hypothetical protein [Streptomyces thermolilacinus]|uniref:Uncharacterized protein n=1 Tax=Streptomyces thermolilacinus SPC6 TaxID=1306406 RepID=A0A1D3DV43_9ACTN|nr:hypothetical protein [Streptomyces thermolilacinus]OEJ96185.1 hypothetical protein J116_018640 [Streptomyces thermolilacinus SPC6]